MFDRNSTLRLAISVINRSNQMSEAIATKRHTFHFEARNTHKDFEQRSDSSDDVNLLFIDVVIMTIEDCDAEYTIEIRKVPDHSELEDLVSAAQKLLELRNESFHAWLKDVYRNFRGFEIDTLNSSLLAVIMKR